MEVICYVNGKRVTEDELSNYEIRSEKVKKIFAEKLAEINSRNADLGSKSNYERGA